MKQGTIVHRPPSHARSGGILLKRPAELERIREAGRVVAAVLTRLKCECRPGITTLELDETAAAMIRVAGGQASFLGYRVQSSTGEKVFPRHICVSINEEVVHGIPGRRRLLEGDIVGVDVGVFLDGFHADSAATYPVGEVTVRAERLLRVTEAALHAGIQAAQAGRRIGSISSAIQRYAETRGFKVVRTLVGHGIGRSLHEDPQVPNYGEPASGEKLVPGMTLAIEPMVNTGSADVTSVLGDEWTIATEDGGLSAHFEHTVAITRRGPEILTLPAEAGTAGGR